MKTQTLLIACAAISLAACQPAAEDGSAETADAAEDAGAPAAASASGADTVEARVREGLWQTTMTSEGLPPVVSRVCTDGTTTALSTSNQSLGPECDQAIRRTADGMTFTSRCEMGQGGVQVTEGVLTGDFQSSYRMEATSTTTGATPEAMNGTRSMVMEVVHQGACPEGWRPGDMEIPGMGARVNVNDLRDQALARAQGGG